MRIESFFQIAAREQDVEATLRANMADSDFPSSFTLLTRLPGDAERCTAELTPSPEFLARYALHGAIGSGAMGSVFRARQLSTERAVAVKFLARLDRMSLARFVHEGKLLARISHPGVLRILDAGVEDEHPYLVTELLSGGTLRDRMRGARALPWEVAVPVAIEILEALQACHEADIVHRDVKPENILFDAAGSVRLADFGIARLLIDPARLTRTGALVGTPLYMSPEQVIGEEATPGSDLYALGCVLFELLVGRAPYGGHALAEILARHVQAPIPDVRADVPDVPAGVADALARSLGKLPEDRAPSAAAFASELRTALTPRAGPRKKPRPHSAPDRPRPTRTGRSARRAFAALVVGIALALIAVACLRPPQSPSVPVTATINASAATPAAPVQTFSEARRTAPLTEPGYHVAFGPRDGQLVSVTPGGPLVLWNVASGTRVRSIEQVAPVRRLAFVEQGAAIQALCDDLPGANDALDSRGARSKWDLDGHHLPAPPWPGPHAVVSPDGRWVATYRGTPVVQSVGDSLGAALALPVRVGWDWAALADGGQRLVSECCGVLSVIDIPRRTKIRELLTGDAFPRLELDATGSRLLAATSSTVRVFDLDTGAVVRELPWTGATQIAWETTSGLVAAYATPAGGTGPRLLIAGPASAAPLVIDLPAAPVALAARADRVASQLADGRILVHDARTGKPVRELRP